MTECDQLCDDDLLTPDTGLPSDSDILAKFQLDDNELEEEDEVVFDEPPPKRPSKQELCHAVDVLLSYCCCRRSVCLQRFISILSNPTLEKFQG